MLLNGKPIALICCLSLSPPVFFLSESLLKKQRDPTCCLPRQCASQLLEAPCSRDKAL